LGRNIYHTIYLYEIVNRQFTLYYSNVFDTILQYILHDKIEKKLIFCGGETVVYDCETMCQKKDFQIIIICGYTPCIVRPVLLKVAIEISFRKNFVE
jgi:hypothetical protein